MEESTIIRLNPMMQPNRESKQYQCPSEQVRMLWQSEFFFPSDLKPSSKFVVRFHDTIAVASISINNSGLHKTAWTHTEAGNTRISSLLKNSFLMMLNSS